MAVQVKFLVDKVALGQDFLRVLRFCPVSIIPLLLHTHHHSHAALPRRTNGQSKGTIKPQCSFRNMGALDMKLLSLQATEIKHCTLQRVQIYQVNYGL